MEKTAAVKNVPVNAERTENGVVPLPRLLGHCKFPSGRQKKKMWAPRNSQNALRTAAAVCLLLDRTILTGSSFYLFYHPAPFT